MIPLLLAQVGHWDWQAWSPARQSKDYEAEVAPTWLRPIGSKEPTWTRGWEIAAGVRRITRDDPFRFSLSTRPTFRILGGAGYAASWVQTVSVGLQLGPVEPDVGGGLSLITVDAVHGTWSAELLSPRAATGVWLHLGHLRIGAHVFGEYLWRWFGNDSYLLRGVALELGFQQRPE